MAKVVGLVGSASGKIGNVVYAVTNGIQVARVYQPQVYNPKSPLQSIQRAKGNLAGRTSSLVPRTAIMGLGVNNRARRGVFLRNMLKKAVVSVSNDVYKASVSSQDVLFSNGSVTISVGSPVFEALANSLGITLSGSGSGTIPADVYSSLQTRIVVMVYDNTTKDLVEVVTKMVTKPEQGATAVTRVPIIHAAGYIADVYAIPMSTADGSAVTISTDMAAKDDDTIAAELSLNANAVAFNYGKSVYLGYSTYTQTQSKDVISENETKKTSKK